MLAGIHNKKNKSPTDNKKIYVHINKNMNKAN